MKLLVEDTLPLAEHYLSHLGDITRYSWQNIRPSDLRNQDVLVCRSTTKVDADLLSEASQLKAVATATAGFNHLNTDYLLDQAIPWFSAAGCNAIAVAQYVISALAYIQRKRNIELNNIEVGIVGAGHVGQALAKMLDSLSIRYVLCDPPLAEQSPDNRQQYVSLDRALQCHVVSLHVPHTVSGPYPTDNLINQHRLNQFNDSQWLINACRGEVVDETALLSLKTAGKGPGLIWDCWQNEPYISRQLMSCCDIATPHIAGHTDEGKVRGTLMVAEWLTRQLSEQTHAALDHDLNKVLDRVSALYASAHMIEPQPLLALLTQAYDIVSDHRNFVENMAHSEAFSSLRKRYSGRREYTAYTVLDESVLTHEQQNIAAALGFTLP